MNRVLRKPRINFEMNFASTFSCTSTLYLHESTHRHQPLNDNVVHRSLYGVLGPLSACFRRLLPSTKLLGFQVLPALSPRLSGCRMKQHIINYRRADPDDVELVVQLNDEDADEEIHLLMGGAEEAARRRSHLQASSPRPSRPSAPFTARTNVTHPAPRLRERGAKRALLPPSEDVVRPLRYRWCPVERGPIGFFLLGQSVSFFPHLYYLFSTFPASLPPSCLQVVVEDDARTAAPPRPRSTSGASAHRTRFLPPPPPDAPGSPEVLALRRPALDRPVVVIEDEEDPDLIVVESGGAAKRPRTETRTGETDPVSLAFTYFTHACTILHISYVNRPAHASLLTNLTRSFARRLASRHRPVSRPPPPPLAAPPRQLHRGPRAGRGRAPRRVP